MKNKDEEAKDDKEQPGPAAGMKADWTELHTVMQTKPGARLRLVAVVLLWLGTAMAHGADDDALAVAALHARYGLLQDDLGHNAFDRPLHLESSETAGGVTGDIHALIDQPFVPLSAALSGTNGWCDILLLHLNTKYCRAASDVRGSVLRVYIGKKHEQPLDDAYPVDFSYRTAAARPDYLKVMLSADDGPLSTHDYRIMLEAVPLDGDRTILHLSYAYAYGLAGRVAMQAYLGTVGSDKRGFTVTGKQAGGAPVYIGGMRGLVERNAMRYYLAIEAYLGALSAPPQARLEKSLHDWFAAAEAYPRQLHEMEQGEYLAMKRKEYSRARGEVRAP